MYMWFLQENGAWWELSADTPASLIPCQFIKHAACISSLGPITREDLSRTLFLLCLSQGFSQTSLLPRILLSPDCSSVLVAVFWVFQLVCFSYPCKTFFQTLSSFSTSLCLWCSAVRLWYASVYRFLKLCSLSCAWWGHTCHHHLLWHQHSLEHFSDHPQIYWLARKIHRLIKGSILTDLRIMPVRVNQRKTWRAERGWGCGGIANVTSSNSLVEWPGSITTQGNLVELGV